MMIESREFTPETYEKDGYMSFISMRQDTPYINPRSTGNQFMYMMQNEIDFFSFKWLDTS